MFKVVQTAYVCVESETAIAVQLFLRYLFTNPQKGAQGRVAVALKDQVLVGGPACRYLLIMVQTSQPVTLVS